MNDLKAIEAEFRKWLLSKVSSTTAEGYIKSLKEEIPKKLRELREKDESFVSIFQITDTQELEKLYNRLLEGGDLHEWNKETPKGRPGRPSAAIRKYIKFLKQK